MLVSEPEAKEFQDLSRAAERWCSRPDGGPPLSCLCGRLPVASGFVVAALQFPAPRIL